MHGGVDAMHDAMQYNFSTGIHTHDLTPAQEQALQSYSSERAESKGGDGWTWTARRAGIEQQQQQQQHVDARRRTDERRADARRRGAAFA